MEFFNKWAPWFMWKLQGDFKISLLSSAAIIGNSGQESGGFKSLQEKKPVVPGSRGGYGIMQWTGPRRKLYEAYCKRNGFDPANMEVNYKFLFVELHGDEGKDGKVLERVEAAKTLDEKTEIFMKEFLRPGTPHLDQRKIWATRALKAWEASEYAKKPIPVPVDKPEPSPTTPEPEKLKTSLWSILWEIIYAYISSRNR